MYRVVAGPLVNCDSIFHDAVATVACPTALAIWLRGRCKLGLCCRIASNVPRCMFVLAILIDAARMRVLRGPKTLFPSLPGKLLCITQSLFVFANLIFLFFLLPKRFQILQRVAVVIFTLFVVIIPILTRTTIRIAIQVVGVEVRWRIASVARVHEVV